MQQGFPKYPGSREQLRAENDWMKRKLMKGGAKFGQSDFFKSIGAEEVENILLKNIIEYERQSKTAKKIKVYDKIEKPKHFRPAASVPDNEIDKALEEVISWLNKYSLDLDVCSPSVTNRELYRFTIEELFHHLVDDIHVDGMVTCFVYDEFHPDPVYDNTVIATDFCMKGILNKVPMTWMHRFRKENLRLNEHSSLTVEQLKEKINNYKAGYDDLTVRSVKEDECTLAGDKCHVKGVYTLDARRDNEVHRLVGTWKVHFVPAAKVGHWDIVALDIEGVQF